MIIVDWLTGIHLVGKKGNGKECFMNTIHIYYEENIQNETWIREKCNGMCICWRMWMFHVKKEFGFVRSIYVLFQRKSTSRTFPGELSGHKSKGGFWKMIVVFDEPSHCYKCIVVYLKRIFFSRNFQPTDYKTVSRIVLLLLLEDIVAIHDVDFANGECAWLFLQMNYELEYACMHGGH